MSSPIALDLRKSKGGTGNTTPFFRGVGHGALAAGGGVEGRAPGSGDLQLVVLDRAGALAGQVPVDVAGEVDDGGLGGGGLVVDAPLAVLGEGVGDLRLERSRV